MTSTSTSTSTLYRIALPRRVVTVLIAALFGVTLAVNPVTAPKSEALISAASGARVVRVATAQIGIPYVWGGTTRRGFDCSGLTQYVYARIGKHIPRTAQQQYNATTRVSAKRPGDLVFFYNRGNVYHVAIWLGNGWIISAPHTGARVSRVRLWTSHVIVKRVR